MSQAAFLLVLTTLLLSFAVTVAMAAVAFVELKRQKPVQLSFYFYVPPEARKADQ